ncbi:flavin-containing monooxygenase [Motilibacter deserti]|uniref:NAD(P)-binding domain-containing protein n=1 Tax=Motilibacter deserti TaxID=2714956 RepID=A0ABX0H316_9ACTN|nr:NAD(P)-binding domain-containing protein [Motilibacter deserti]NHC15798.1 NAD(P)-binding domain-containing protein [Motilibacter deserti]
MTVDDRSTKFCVIGAGAAGLTAAKNLLQLGIEVDVIEREDELGGNWNYGKPNSSIYRSVHMITSKPFTQYTDFPIPAEYPTFLGQRQALAYLRSYAEAFGLERHIEFERTVESVERTKDGLWNVVLDGGEARRYAGLVVANGHLWKPRYPGYRGHFDGVTVHSGDYKTPDVLRGKRVLVVGAGNSGCDIAVEASQNAAVTFHSTRRGYHYWPKYLFGQPSDVVYELALKTRSPLPIRRALGKLFLTVNNAGSAKKYGLPEPSHRLYEEHFIINSTLLYHLGHGDIAPKPDVAELRGDRVLFTDGTEEQVDVIVYATGFQLAEFPFLDADAHLNAQGGFPRLYLNAFHPTYDNLFVIGFFQTSTGNWPLMDYQSQVMARFVRQLRDDPEQVGWFRALKADPGSAGRLNGGIDYYNSERHALEVEHFAYRGALKRLARKLGASQGIPAQRAVSEPARAPEAV